MARKVPGRKCRRPDCKNVLPWWAKGQRKYCTPACRVMHSRERAKDPPTEENAE